MGHCCFCLLDQVLRVRRRRKKCNQLFRKWTLSQKSKSNRRNKLKHSKLKVQNRSLKIVLQIPSRKRKQTCQNRFKQNKKSQKGIHPPALTASPTATSRRQTRASQVMANANNRSQ